MYFLHDVAQFARRKGSRDTKKRKPLPKQFPKITDYMTSKEKTFRNVGVGSAALGIGTLALSKGKPSRLLAGTALTLGGLGTTLASESAGMRRVKDKYGDDFIERYLKTSLNKKDKR